MKIYRLHSWDVSLSQAVELQRTLASRIDHSTPLPSFQLVAGADVSHDLFSNACYAGVVVLKLPDMTVVEKHGAFHESTFPYHSGLFSFREAPPVLDAFRKLKARPDVVLLDGQGFAHPRRCGLASHIGLWLDVPTVGCAKTRLYGTFREPAREVGASEPLMAGEEIIGRVVRTKTGVRPLFVSVGHRIDLASAVRVVLDTAQGYRLPEPARQAHLFVNEMRREAAARGGGSTPPAR